MSELSKSVAQWADELEDIREELGLSPARYPISLGLGFMSVESNGNPKARKKKVLQSQFWGLFQQGHSASLDLGWAPKGRRGWRTAERLHGQPLLAMKSWYRLLERYDDRWGYGPDERHHLEAAILWKGGAGTARRIRDKVRAGEMGFYEAVRWIETHPNKDWRIPRLEEYLRRMDRWHAVAEQWGQQEYERGVVIEPEPQPFHVVESLLEIGLRLFEMSRAV